MSRALVAVTLAALLVGLWAARAHSGDGAPVLHQDVRPPPGAGERRARAEAGLLGPEPSAGRNPTAFASGDKLLPEPAMDPQPSRQETVHGTASFGADRNTQWKPDRGTGPDGTLHYVEVFNPSVVPFKRMSALDGIRSDYTLFVRPSALTDLPIGGATGPERDKFWGSLVIELTTGTDVPIPSVAPDMRILSYEIEPRIEVTFSKDAADNFYVRSDAPGVAGQFRLNFLADAPITYFAPAFDPKTRIRDIPKSMVTPLPPELKESAALAVRELGLSPSMRLKDALDKMTYYFRGFEAKEAPPKGRDIFWDLFQSQAGVCRHRSFAFVVVAAAIGIPARYVTNEAHAWVEVWAPGPGWLRLDLGGAAMTLEVSNAKGKTMYQPRTEDPFDKPPNYLNNYSRLEGDVEGLSSAQLAEARQPAGAGDNPLAGEGEGEGESGDANGRGGRRRAPGPGSELPQLPESEVAGKAMTFVKVTATSKVGFRGEAVSVRGRVHDDHGVGIGDLGVEIYLAPAHAHGENAVWIGSALTTADGSFQIDLSLPAELDLGSYEVFAGVAGNDTYRPAISD